MKIYELKYGKKNYTQNKISKEDTRDGNPTNFRSTFGFSLRIRQKNRINPRIRILIIFLKVLIKLLKILLIEKNILVTVPKY